MNFGAALVILGEGWTTSVFVGGRGTSTGGISTAVDDGGTTIKDG